MRAARRLAAAVALLVGACASWGAEPATTAEDARVYAAVLDSLATPGVVVVQATTLPWPLFRDPLPQAERARALREQAGVDLALATRFVRVSRRPRPILGAIRGSRPVRLVPARDLPQSGSTPEEWRAFSRRFGSAAASHALSGVAYDGPGRTALVAYWRGCGGPCGYEQLVVLRRAGGRRRVDRVIRTHSA